MAEGKKAVKVVGQANDLVKAFYSMSVVQKRLVLLGLSKIRYSEPVPPSGYYEFTLPVADWKAVYSHKNDKTAYAQLKAAADRLMHHREGGIFFPLRSDESKEQRWFQQVVYRPKAGEIQMKFTPVVSEYLGALIDSIGYTPIDLLAINELDSFYSLRIYELCKCRLGLGGFFMDVSELREILQATDKYPSYTEFRRNVITRAERDINSKTDLLVTVRQHKDGKKISRLQFTVAKKSAGSAKAVPVKRKPADDQEARP